LSPGNIYLEFNPTNPEQFFKGGMPYADEELALEALCRFHPGVNPTVSMWLGGEPERLPG